MSAHDYGDRQEPGIISDLTSSEGVPTSGGAPTDLGLVGQANIGADPRQGSADPNTVYEVTRSTTAREWFGHEDDSLLTQAILDCLRLGAYPIYAVAPASKSGSEDISSISDEVVTLPNGPLREDEGDIVVTLNGSELTNNLTYQTVSKHTTNEGECHFNPVHATVQLPSIPTDSTTDTIEYEYFDYPTAIQAMVDDGGEAIDFFVPLSEKTSVTDAAEVAVDNMQSEYELALLEAGAEIYIEDTLEFSYSYDNSRVQLIYPTRFEDGSSALAAYAGLRATLGLDSTPINNRIGIDRRLMHNLTREQRGNLIDNSVVPLADEAAGARVADDPTTVTEDNTDERNLQYGYNRLVMDYIIETVRDNERPYIGRLHNPTIRRTFKGVVESELTELQKAGIVLNYSVNVAPVSPTEAELEYNVSLAEPLRFISNSVTVGRGATLA